MSSTIDALLEEVFRNEGGFVNDPDDAGGATNMGITKATLEQHRGHAVSVEDVKALTKDEASEIYLDRYLRGPKIDQLPEAVWPVVFDWGVNAGPGRAIKALQKVVGVDADGGIGPKTIAAAKAACDANASAVINRICDERDAFYHGIAERNPSQMKFLRGWLARSARFRVK